MYTVFYPAPAWLAQEFMDIDLRPILGPNGASFKCNRKNIGCFEGNFYFSDTT